MHGGKSSHLSSTAAGMLLAFAGTAGARMGMGSRVGRKSLKKKKKEKSGKAQN